MLLNTYVDIYVNIIWHFDNMCNVKQLQVHLYHIEIKMSTGCIYILYCYRKFIYVFFFKLLSLLLLILLAGT